MTDSLWRLKATPAQLRDAYGERAAWLGNESDDAPRARLGKKEFSCDGRFMVADGTLAVLKWSALALMLLDHINKFFFGEQLPAVFALGRIVMPIFGFVVVYNLARPGALELGVHRRMMGRLALTGIVATPISFALNGTVVSQHAWWPLNILFTLFTVVAMIGLIERGGAVRRVTAAVLFIVAGSFVEYLWVGVLACLGAWVFCRRATPPRLLVWFLGVLSLIVINANTWALLAIPVVWLASRMTLHLPRSKWAFYVFYPAHLAALLAIKELIRAP